MISRDDMNHFIIRTEYSMNDELCCYAEETAESRGCQNRPRIRIYVCGLPDYSSHKALKDCVRDATMILEDIAMEAMMLKEREMYEDLRD